MSIDQQRRLEEGCGGGPGRAGSRRRLGGERRAWRRYVLIEDAMRDPQDLLDEGVALSKIAIDLWQQRGGDFATAAAELDQADAPRLP